MRTAPHILILASILALGACSPAADAPTPKSADAPSKAEAASTASTSSSTSPSSTTSKPQPANENARLDLWFAAQYKASTRAYPQQLTSLGIDERQDEWNDNSRSFRLEQLDKSREALEEMRERFDVEKLDADHKLSYRLFEKNVEDSIAGRKWWDHNYTYSQMRGAHSSLPTFLMNNHKIKTSKMRKIIWRASRQLMSRWMSSHAKPKPNSTKALPRRVSSMISSLRAHKTSCPARPSRRRAIN